MEKVRKIAAFRIEHNLSKTVLGISIENHLSFVIYHAKPEDKITSPNSLLERGNNAGCSQPLRYHVHVLR